MHAIVIYEAGGPEKLIDTKVPTPTVREGWSLVRVHGFGINHSEIFTRRGLSPSVSFPRILGIECVGIIEETTDPKRLPKGCRVVSIMGEMGRAFDGGYAEFALLPNEQIYPIQSALSWEALAAIPETGYTAYGSLCNLRISAEDRVLVRGATSGVGIAFAHFLKAMWPSIHLSGTTRRAEKAERLRGEGYDAVILDPDGKLPDGETFDKVLELIGPATLQDTFAHVNEGGIVCSTGQLGGVWDLNGFEPITMLPANGYLTSFYSANVNQKKLQAMLDAVEAYQVELLPERVFSLSEVPLAHAYLESSGSFGKVVVVIP